MQLLSEAEERQLDSVLRGMSLRQKLGQMMQPDWRNFRALPRFEAACAAVLPAPASIIVRRALNGPLGEEACANGLGADGLGSVLGGGGACPLPNAPASWQAQARAMHAAAVRTGARIPLLVCNDSVHGHANLRDATLFPHHIGQGCTRDPGLVERLAAVAAKESHACAAQWGLGCHARLVTGAGAAGSASCGGWQRWALEQSRPPPPGALFATVGGATRLAPPQPNRRCGINGSSHLLPQVRNQLGLLSG
jgi:hypothetical protein